MNTNEINIRRTEFKPIGHGMSENSTTFGVVVSGAVSGFAPALASSANELLFMDNSDLYRAVMGLGGDLADQIRHEESENDATVLVDGENISEAFEFHAWLILTGIPTDSPFQTRFLTGLSLIIRHF